jgi:Protein of unknown function (DUF2800)
MDHAKYSPSGAAFWYNCPGGHFYNQTIKEDDKFKKYSEEGTALHHYASAYFDWHRNKGGFLNAVGRDYSKEKFLKIYFDYVFARASYALDWRIEERLTLIPDLVWGTADCVIIGKDFLEIIDLKTGFTEVKAKRNLQLIVYALSAIKTFNLDPLKVQLTIVQPKLNCISTNLYNFRFIKNFEKRIHRKVEDLEDLGKGAMTLQTGPYCRFCRGNEFCPLYKKSLM